MDESLFNGFIFGAVVAAAFILYGNGELLIKLIAQIKKLSEGWFWQEKARRQCSKCGQEISDQAASCPSCGEPVPETVEATRPPETPVLGIVALGLGLAGLTMPYFESMFFVPGAFLCGLIALKKGESLLEKGLGGTGLVLGMLGFLYIAF